MEKEKKKIEVKLRSYRVREIYEIGGSVGSTEYQITDRLDKRELMRRAKELNSDIERRIIAVETIGSVTETYLVPLSTVLSCEKKKNEDEKEN